MMRYYFRLLKQAIVLLTAFLLSAGIYNIIFLLIQTSTNRCKVPYGSIEDVVPHIPFDNGDPKFVIILAYQRGGSTFFGELFNQNPNMFYMFEPIDSLYSSMYGTRQNWNVPSDINHYSNGTRRSLPDLEIHGVATFLNQLLHCELDRLPTETLTHVYWMFSWKQFKVSNKYAECIRKSFKFSFRNCAEKIVHHCGSRFGEESEDRLIQCNRILSSEDVKSLNESDRVLKNFKQYKTCMKYLRHLVSKTCQPSLLETCQIRSVRVTKVVRASMRSMELLLDEIPNLRIIHLIRDPRAVALSRIKFKGGVLGIWAGNDSDTVVKEAEMYCNTVVDDVRVRSHLNKKHPGKILSIIYEHLVVEPWKYMEGVYRFLDEPIHDEVTEWLANEGHADKHGRGSRDIAKAWRQNVTFKDNERILERCRRFFEIVEHEKELD